MADRYASRPDDTHPRLPALTGVEADLVDHYLKVVDDLARLNPATVTGTYGALLAAQALASHAAAVRDALEQMFARGETELYPGTLARALHSLDAPARIARLAVPAVPPEP